MRIPKGSTVSKELSKHFGRVFNTKETFIFDIGKEDSDTHLYGKGVHEYLKQKHQVNVKGKNDGKKIERSKNFQVVSQSNKGTSGEE
nr:hypothetical protein [uncultured Mediterranean phage uvMED]